MVKKLALVAAVTAIAFPAASEAKDSRGHSEAYTYEEVDQSQPASPGQGAYRIEMQAGEEDFSMNSGNRALTFSTLEGEKLIVKGKTVYKVAANGDRFHAPNGSYMTRENVRIVVEDGLLGRIE